MPNIAPMLSLLGYDPTANPPDYGKPDSFVQQNMIELERDRKVWEAKEKEVHMIRDSIRSDLMKQRAEQSNKETDNDVNQNNFDSENNNPTKLSWKYEEFGKDLFLFATKKTFSKLYTAK